MKLTIDGLFEAHAIQATPALNDRFCKNEGDIGVSSLARGSTQSDAPQMFLPRGVLFPRASPAHLIGHHNCRPNVFESPDDTVARAANFETRQTS